ncbi:MAG: hypothetical protein AAF416_21605 [Pseudomonadota bacterium]
MQAPSLATATPDRVDRYQDWERRRLPPQVRRPGDNFCIAVVELPGIIDLFRSAAAVFGADVSAELPPDAIDSVSIVVPADERRAIEDVLADDNLLSLIPTVPYLRIILLFMRESDIYEGDGIFKTYSFMKILYASPPIDGFERPEGPRTASFIPQITVKPGTQIVAMGIIDDAIAFAHDRFQDTPASTRILNFWAQNYDDRGRLGIPKAPYGLALTKVDIDDRLREADQNGWSDRRLYSEAGALDLSDPNGYAPLARRLGHGTHVLDLAAGGDGTERPIFAVQLRAEASEDTSGTSLAAYLIHGVLQIFRWADRYGEPTLPPSPLPLVINFSYGILAGLKDGSHIIEQLLDLMIQGRRTLGRETEVVLPAGNSYRSRTTARLTLQPGEPKELDWLIQPDDRTPSFVEIWARDPGHALPLKVTLIAPGGSGRPLEAPVVGDVAILLEQRHPIAAAYSDRYAGAAGQNTYRVLLAIAPTRLPNEGVVNWPPAPCGRWSIKVESTGGGPLIVDVQVQRDDTPIGFPRAGRQSRLDHESSYDRDNDRRDWRGLGHGPIRHENTVSAISTGQYTKVVGAALVGQSVVPSDYTSKGGAAATNPDAGAIADEGYAMPGVMAAGINSGTAIAMRGTSVAAPQLARVLADEIASATPRPSPVPADPTRLGNRLVDERRKDIPARRRL